MVVIAEAKLLSQIWEATRWEKLGVLVQCLDVAYLERILYRIVCRVECTVCWPIIGLHVVDVKMHKSLLMCYALDCGCSFA